VDAGWRVVAPFMRGYAPTSVPSDGNYHVGALMDDALRVLDAAGPTGRDVFIGHDWGALAAAGLAAMPDSPFTKAVIMSVPISAAFRPLGRVPQSGRLATKLPRQLLHSWYMIYFQLPWLPDRSTSWVVPKLWRDWSPGYRADEDLRHVDAAIGEPQRWHAALGYYRAAIRNSRPPAQYAGCYRTKASSQSSKTADTSCSSISPMLSRGTSSTSWDRPRNPNFVLGSGSSGLSAVPASERQRRE
jgi:pimeloyl-ACP methyl ester carboxylesterase